MTLSCAIYNNVDGRSELVPISQGRLSEFIRKASVTSLLEAGLVDSGCDVRIDQITKKSGFY